MQQGHQLRGLPFSSPKSRVSSLHSEMRVPANTIEDGLDTFPLLSTHRTRLADRLACEWRLPSVEEP